MKDGARSLIPAREGSVFTDNAWSTLGVGWLGACIVLSGSPVAASSLTLLDGGAIDRTQSFAMLTGSRLGASFVVRSEEHTSELQSLMRISYAVFCLKKKKKKTKLTGSIQH